MLLCVPGLEGGRVVPLGAAEQLPEGLWLSLLEGGGGGGGCDRGLAVFLGCWGPWNCPQDWRGT